MVVVFVRFRIGSCLQNERIASLVLLSKFVKVSCDDLCNASYKCEVTYFIDRCVVDWHFFPKLWKPKENCDLSHSSILSLLIGALLIKDLVCFAMTSCDFTQLKSYLCTFYMKARIFHWDVLKFLHLCRYVR